MDKNIALDTHSTNLIKIALYLDQKVPGIVSEIWIGDEHVAELKSHLPAETEIENFISKTQSDISSLRDVRRQTYLREVVDSLAYQIKNLHVEKFSYADFSQHTFGFRIERVSETEIRNIEQQLSHLASKTGLTRQQIFQKYHINIADYQSTFASFVANAKEKLPQFISDFPDEGFLFEVVTSKPWSAFNSHIAPFKSKLTLNSDVGFTKLDLHRLAYHEAYGGHHSELSHKDVLLTQQARGEHGLVITFSPQTFMSEAIAEGIYVLLGGLDTTNDDQMVGWYYDRLIFALQNAATFWFFEDGLERDEIKSKLQRYAISEKTIENVLKFSTDSLFGKYAPVYFTAFDFLQRIYAATDQKEALIKTLFTQPCTPQLLISEFGKKS